MLNPNQESINNDSSIPDKEYNKNDLTSSNSNLKANESITGHGDNQTIRTYFVNQSYSNNNLGSFNISVPDNYMNLSHGDFNFTFNNNYTTEHVIENDNALTSLDPSKMILYPYNKPTSGLNLLEGQNPLNEDFTAISNLITYWNLTSQNGALNFSINANFSKSTSTDNVPPSGTVETVFNRTEILGFLLSIKFNITLDANLTIKAWNVTQGAWINITDIIPINSSLPITQQIDERFINTNLDFINSSDISLIQFYFNRTDHSSTFNVSLFEFDLQAALAFDLPITSESYVALEFDLRGEGTTINGFNAWIRTLNRTMASGVKLNISLYRSNNSIVRDSDGLQKTMISPDYSQYLGSILIDSFKGDGITYFDLSSINAVNLGIGNYFIVINSSSSDLIYSLVTIPSDASIGDGKLEQQLKRTTNNGVTWTNAKKLIETTSTPYTSTQLDASSFELNVTRGYMPSDFNGELRIQNLTLVDQRIDVYPYNESNVNIMEWGSGRWLHDLTDYIEADRFNTLFVNFTGYITLTKGLLFNVTYLAKIYRYENVTALFKIYYNDIPLWTLNDTLDPNQYYPNWNFTEYWFIFPNYWTPLNLTTPNPLDGDVLDQIGSASELSDDPLFNKLILTTALINVSMPVYNGSYVLNLTSYNSINQMHSFINFEGILWETEGFMYGDNVSLSVYIQDEFGIAPDGGSVNATLFYPNNTRVPTAELFSNNGVLIDSLLKYDFSNNTIINITTSIPILGRYQIGFFWTNGTAIGCKKVFIQINDYEVDLTGATFYPEVGSNVLEGNFITRILNKYSILMATVNETTGTNRPDYYTISNLSINQLFSYELGSLDFDVSLNSFRQNESILNPGEEITFKILLQNRDDITDLNVRIKVQLLSLANDQWIIAENSSDTVLLKYFGNNQDSIMYNLSMMMPQYDPATKSWKGVNCPMRLGGVKTRVLIYIEGKNVGYFDSPQYSLITLADEHDFEGEIISTKTSFNTSSNTITKVFERDECLYSPKKTYFIVNLFDENYMSILISSNISNIFKINSKFVNITYTPQNPIEGDTVTISSIMETEFNEILAGKIVSCEYFDGTSWINITGVRSDSEGILEFEIDTVPLYIMEDFKFRLYWPGDSNFLSKSHEIPINITSEFNELSLGFDVLPNQAVYRNENGTLTFAILNTGNSTVSILETNIALEKGINFTIVAINNYELARLKPGESTSITIDFFVPDTTYDLLNITVTIKGQNVLSKQIVRTEGKTSLDILDPPFPSVVMTVSILIGIGGIWLFTIWYARKLIRKIETPLEKAKPKVKKVKGKYVKVSELKTDETKKVPSEEKPTVEKEAKKEEKEAKVKLDDLLKKEGLDKE